MTRKIIFSLLICCPLLLTSCLETEEKIVIKNDNSGDYTMSMDMGKILEMAKQMGQGKDNNDKIPDKKDSTLYFKSYVDTSTALSAAEKEMLRDGSLRLKIDEEESELKFVIHLPFKKIQDLPKLRETYMVALNKLGVMDKMKDKKDGDESQEIPSDLSSGSKTINPAQDSYTLSAAPGKIAYKLTDKKLYEQQMNDSSMQMMKSMGAMMGDMNFKTVIVLPKPVKKYKGSEANVSADKKTITFKSSLGDFFEKPEAFEYELEY
jgi:hypothetical protein